MEATSIRSQHSRVRVYLTFVNYTGNRVRLYWVNYQGKKRAYRDLNPGDSFNVNTYETHPWVCYDIETGDQLLLNRQEVLFAERDPHYKLERTPVCITIPLCRLDDRCIQVIRKLLRSKDDIPRLGLPSYLERLVEESYLQLPPPSTPPPPPIPSSLIM